MKKVAKKSGYKYAVSVFCARNSVSDSQAKNDARELGKYFAKRDVTLVNGAGHTGLMQYISEACFKNSGRVYGVGLHKYEPQPHKLLTDWEAYDSHSARQNRLIELGDVIVVLEGGLGTLLETLHVHIGQFLNEIHKPLILVGEFGEFYKGLVEHFRKKGLLHKLPSDIHYCKTYSEAIAQLEKIFTSFDKQQYRSDSYYPAMTPEQIYYHLKKISEPHYVLFCGIQMKVLPGVYPSNRFRSSKMLGQYVATHSKGKRVADIACGHGTMGLVAAKNGAVHVVQSDINPTAVENARQNAALHALQNKIDIYEGDTFEPLSHRYANYFDIIYFNPPFHKDVAIKNDKLMYAFYTQGSEGGVLDKFLMRAKDFLAPNGEILIGFSSKDKENNEFLKKAMTKYGFEWKVESVLNTSTAADNILYKLKVSHSQIQKATENPVFKLGIVLSQSGISRVDGQSMRKGVELAVKDLARENLQVKLAFSDDRGTPDGAVKAVDEVIAKFVPDAIIGPTWSNLIDVCDSLLTTKKITYFTPATSYDVVKSDGQYRLYGSPSNDIKSRLLAEFCKNTNSKNIVYFRRKNTWGERHSELFSKTAAELGGDFKEIALPDIVQTSDIKKAIASMPKADVVLLDNYEDVTLPLLVNLYSQSPNSKIIFTLNLTPNILQDLKKLPNSHALHSMKLTVPAEFKERFTHAYAGDSATAYAYNAYIGVQFLVRAKLQSGSSKLSTYITQNMKLNMFGDILSFDNSNSIVGKDWILQKIDF